jgi:hypothetical protein
MMVEEITAGGGDATVAGHLCGGAAQIFRFREIHPVGEAKLLTRNEGFDRRSLSRN